VPKPGKPSGCVLLHPVAGSRHYEVIKEVENDLGLRSTRKQVDLHRDEALTEDQGGVD